MLTFGKNNSVNFIISDHAIRYVDGRAANLNGVKEFGEYYFPARFIREGKIVAVNQLEAAIEECVEKWKLKNRSVNFVIPDSLVLFRKLSIPKEVKADELKSYLYLEIGSSIHLPFEDPLFDFHSLGVKGDKQELLLFAAPEKAVLQYKEVLELAKLRPNVADISSLTAYRLYHQLDLSSQKEHLLLLQFSLTSISVAAFHQHQPVILRHIGFSAEEGLWKEEKSEHGESALVCTNIEKMQGELRDQLVEIERVINFYKFSVQQGTAEITKIFVAGDHPYLDYIINELNEVLGVSSASFPAELASTVRGNSVPLRYYLALGLLIKEV